MSTYARIPAAILVLITLAGCDQSGIEYPGSVAPSEIQGDWHLTLDSRELAKRDGADLEDVEWIEVQLRDDGTCRLRLFRLIFDPKGRIEGEGKWKVEGEKILFEMEDSRFYRNESLYLGREDGVLILYDWHGDPDSFEFLKYGRAND